MNLLIADLLFLLTAACMAGSLTIAHYIRKQKRKETEPNATETQEKEKKKNKKERWGVEKDAYCYPSINDVMGYDFVNVIKVGNELSEEKKQDIQQIEEWGNSQGNSRLKIVSSNETPDSSTEDEAYPEQTSSFLRDKQTKRENTEGEITEDGDVTQLEGFKEEDLDMLPDLQDQWGEWTHQDTGSIPDEELDALINSNENIIETPRMDEEQARIAEDIDALRKAYRATERKNYASEIQDLLSDSEYVPEKDDIPQI